MGEAFGIMLAFGLVVTDDVEYAHLEILLREQQVLMLGMDVEQSFAELAQVGNGRRRIVDERAALACCCQFAADDAVMPVEVEVVLLEEGIQSVAVEVELCLDDASVGSVLDHACLGSLAKQQGDGSEENALTGACLARDDRKAAIEAYVERSDEGVVLYGK